MRDELLRAADVAEWLNVHPDTLGKWRKKGIGPRFIARAPATRWVRYPRSAVEEWLERGDAA